MRLACFDFLFGVVSSTVGHGENTVFEDFGTDGCTQRLASLHRVIAVVAEVVVVAIAVTGVTAFRNNTPCCILASIIDVFRLNINTLVTVGDSPI